MKVFPLSLRIFILNCPVCFAVIKFLSASLIYLSVSTNYPGKISEIYCVVLQVAPESKIQLVSCDLYPKFLLGISTLEYIHAIDAYILCASLLSVLFSNVLSIFFNLYAQFLGFSVFQ